MSMRFVAGVNQPGYNPYGQTVTTITYNLFSWGTNGSGQLGLGNVTGFSSPKQIGALTDWSVLAVGGTFSAAVKTDGTLWTWGVNTYGELGDGTVTPRSSPVQVGALTTWSYVSCTGDTTLAIKTDGTLWGWGRNNQGQLGLNNRTDYSSPKQVGALTNWSKIYVGSGGACVSIKTDGTLWTWGSNSAGELGLGNRTSYSSPKQVGALTNWTSAFSVGDAHMMAVKTDGTLWGWGNSNVGQLGQGNRTNYSSPKQVGALTTWSQCTAGASNTLAVKTDGTLWSWGYNNWGQLGLGNQTYYSSPKQVGALTNWSQVKIYSNGLFTAAIKTDGTVWTWGRNNQGQLGQSNLTDLSSPKQVGSLTNWRSIVCGEAFVLAQG